MHTMSKLPLFAALIGLAVFVTVQLTLHSIVTSDTTGTTQQAVVPARTFLSPAMLVAPSDGIINSYYYSDPNERNQHGEIVRGPNMTFAHHWRPRDGRPDLRTVLDPQNNTFIGDPADMLQIAIAGFGKCGTTTIMKWLEFHPELQLFPQELLFLGLGQPEKFVETMSHMPVGRYLRGYKSPNDLTFAHVPDYFRKYFYKAKIVLGIRHPVQWFESLYNFRVQNMPPRYNLTKFPRPSSMFGACGWEKMQICTHKGEFALHLRNLGLTVAPHSATSRGQLTALERRMYDAANMTPPTNLLGPVPNPVFLFELQQLQDLDVQRSATFGRDLQRFLNLSLPLPPLPHYKPGLQWKDKYQVLKDAHKISICDAEHLPMRKRLVEMARYSSIWLRHCLLPPHTNLHVSSPAYLNELLERWMLDPCDDRDVDLSPTRNVGRWAEALVHQS